MAETTSGVLLSEQTKDMTQEELQELQAKVAGMTPEELKEYRNSQDPDSMGFWGEESGSDGSTDDQ
jgi:hypothetical protein